MVVCLDCVIVFGIVFVFSFVGVVGVCFLSFFVDVWLLVFYYIVIGDWIIWFVVYECIFFIFVFFNGVCW